MPTVIIRLMVFSIVGFNRDDLRNKSLYIFDGRALVAGMICSHRAKLNSGKEVTVNRLFSLALYYQEELAEDSDTIGLEVV